MRKHYGQVVKTCIKIAFASALLLIISGVLSYAIKGKVIAILEIIAGIIAFCAVIFIRNKRNESVNNFLEIMAKSSNSISANSITAMFSIRKVSSIMPSLQKEMSIIENNILGRFELTDRFLKARKEAAFRKTWLLKSPIKRS